ncbi:hypothetical protein [Desulfovibrio sp. ZJ200]|uniref:hypothetical protein n=1 Tax=Desulfovibrio sp. ZJ200 TaxID=2709792 RepID=UPI0013EAE370|nr:hypothetical protein [Desulfovibrio sp. ZJ200]
MPDFGYTTLTGASGADYDVKIYTCGSNFNEEPGVFVLSSEYSLFHIVDQFPCDVFYVGETDNIAKTMANDKEVHNNIREFNSDIILFIPEADADRRAEICKDLREAYIS